MDSIIHMSLPQYDFKIKLIFRQFKRKQINKRKRKKIEKEKRKMCFKES